jgi:cation:H+ antiporter
MSGLPLVVLLLIFAGAAAAIWVAGIQLSDQTDVLSTRLHLGAALGGLIMLAVATNLPEIAIVVSAASSGNVGVAVGNILGGIAIQTLVLVALDAAGVRGRHPLTYRAASLVLVLEAALVVAVLAVVVAASQLP